MDRLPAISQLKVLDLGVGLGAALIGRHFADIGAAVQRLEPSNGDPFHDVYPAYGVLRSGGAAIDQSAFDAAVRAADIIITGGEDYPGLEQPRDAEQIAALNGRAIVLELSGGVDGEGAARPAVDLLAQARSGMCFEQFSDKPLAWALPMPSFAMALQGMVGVWAGLVARERTGEGQIVRTSLQHGAAMVCMPDRIVYERDDTASLSEIPLDVRQLIFECADGGWIQFAMQRPGALARVYGVLGIPGEVDPLDTGAKRPDAPPRDFFGDFDLFASYVRKFTRPDLLQAFWDNGIPADAVLKPGENWDDEQTNINGIIRTGADGVRSVALPIQIKAGAKVAPAPLAPLADKTAGPLAGVRVVGLGTFIAGPYVGKALADLGADVIKVDGPGGDPNTKVYSAWWCCNTGKRSIVLDIKTPEGREVLRRLCASADIVHNNFRPGVADRLGIGPKDLRREAPNVLTLESSAYGATGPKATLAGLDPILQAISGQEVRAGGAGNPPLWYRTAVVDYTTGSLGSISLLMGLYERSISGTLLDAQVNLLDSSLYLMSELIQTPDGAFIGAPTVDAEQLGLNPAERLYATRDGWLAVAARSPEMAARLAACLGLDLGPRAGWREATTQVIAAAFAKLDTDAALAALADAEVWAEPCLSLQDGAMERDAGAVAAGLTRTFQDPRYGRIVATGALVQLSKTPAPGPGRAPHFGEHTGELLRDLGYSAAQVEDYLGTRTVA
ncbi:MAG: hypothetical protein JWP35_1948 [Caulobacter sp.]|nr:hypothetical protein [Caulobacter sp.]